MQSGMIIIETNMLTLVSEMEINDFLLLTGDKEKKKRRRRSSNTKRKKRKRGVGEKDKKEWEKREIGRDRQRHR